MSRVVLLALAPAALCGACTGGLHSSAPAVQSYFLQAPAAPVVPAGPVTPAASAHSESAPSLQVARPLAAPGLDSDQIAVLQSDQRLASFTASRWTASLPDLLESLTVDVLRDGGGFSAVEGSRSVFPAQYLLQLSIRDFEADYREGAGPPLVRVRLHALIERRPGREVIASFDVEHSERAAQDRLAAVVAAFQHAADAALAATADTLRGTIRTATAPSPPSGDSASN